MGTKISNLTALGAEPAADDELPIVDTDAGATKRVTFAELVQLPQGYLTGLGLANNGTDSDHDIDIATGECRDAADAADLRLTSSITKQIDAAFAAGTAAGGMFTGSVALDTWYHVFLIEKDSDGTIDAGFDTSSSAANIPAGYTAYRRLGSVLTDGSANILGFRQAGPMFWWDVIALDGASTVGTTAADLTISVPPGFRHMAVLMGRVFKSGSSFQFRIFSPEAPSDETTGSGRRQHGNTAAAGVQASFGIEVLTDTSSQVRLIAAAVTTDYIVNTQGWLDLDLLGGAAA